MARSPLRLREWLTDPSRFATLASAIAAHDWRFAPPDRFITASGAPVPLAALTEDLRRFEDRLTDAQWDVLDAAGFAWTAPRDARPAPMPASTVAGRIAHGDATLEEVIALAHGDPRRAVVVDWMTTGVDHWRRLRVSPVVLLAEPDRVTVGAQPFAIGTFMRQLARAEAYGYVSDALGALPLRHQRFLTPPRIRTLRNFGLLHEHAIRFGSRPIPVQYAVPLADGTAFDLGGWVRQQSSNDRRGRLSPVRRAALETFDGWSRPAGNEHQRQLILDALDAYIAEHGHSHPPQSAWVTLANGRRFALGKWLSMRRVDARRGVLPESLRAALDERGVSWNPYEERFARWVRLLEQFSQREGHANVPKRHIEHDVDGAPYALGTWVMDVRTGIRLGEYPPEKVQMLRDLGIRTGLAAAVRNRRLDALDQFIAREGHAHVPVAHQEHMPDGSVYLLGRALSDLRARRKAGRISPALVADLDARGFVWDAFAYEFAQRVRFLEAFVDREGHAEVAKTHVELLPTGESFALGRWLQGRRSHFNRIGMEPGEAETLYALGCAWADPARNPALTDPEHHRPKRTSVPERLDR